jgi:hypothetical protein
MGYQAEVHRLQALQRQAAVEAPGLGRMWLQMV